MDLLPVLAGCLGGVLVWSALKNKHPLDVIQFTLQGKPLDTARPIYAAAVTPATNAAPGAVLAPELPNAGGGFA